MDKQAQNNVHTSTISIKGAELGGENPLPIFRNKKSTNDTISNVIHAYCPANEFANAETYKTDELISLPQIAVDAN